MAYEDARPYKSSKFDSHCAVSFGRRGDRPDRLRPALDVLGFEASSLRMVERAAVRSDPA